MVTTCGYAVGNVVPMPQRVKNPTGRRRHFIAEWRKFRGLTQEQLAEQIDTTKATISRIESRNIGYTQDTLEAIAEALGTHPGELLSRAPGPRDDAPAVSAPAIRVPPRASRR